MRAPEIKGGVFDLNSKRGHPLPLLHSHGIKGGVQDASPCGLGKTIPFAMSDDLGAGTKETRHYATGTRATPRGVIISTAVRNA